MSEPAVEALVNLSQNPDLATKMVEMGMIKKAMEILYKPDSSIRRLLVMLLVNLTQLDAGTASLLQVCLSSYFITNSVCSLPKLIAKHIFNQLQYQPFLFTLSLSFLYILAKLLLLLTCLFKLVVHVFQ